MNIDTAHSQSSIVWTAEDLQAMFLDIQWAYSPDVKGILFPMVTLLTPMPEIVNRYYEGDPEVNFNRHISHLTCELKCEQCGEVATSKWLSKSTLKMHPDKPFLFADIDCMECRSNYIKDKKDSAVLKWKPRADMAYLTWMKRDDQVRVLPFLENQRIAKTYFGGKKDYALHRWSAGNPSQLLPLILDNFIGLQLEESGKLSFDVIDVAVIPLASEEYSKMFVDWGMDFVKSNGNAISKDSFYFSLKLEEEMRDLIGKSSYYLVSYAIFRAIKEAAGYWELEKRKKDITYKHALRKTLENALDGTWNIPVGSHFHARKNCPDSFWSIVRFEEHDLTEEEIFSAPLGDLGYMIKISSAPVDDEEIIQH